jgi:hypothetical protein
MFILKPVFSLHYPYVKIEKFRPFKKKIIYKPYDIGGDSIVNDMMLRELVKWNKNILLDNQVPINKVRFVFQSSFTYDVDGDIINPKYRVMLPVDEKNGLFVNNAVILEIDKPKTLIKIVVKSYRTDDNYAYLKAVLKYCKRGIVIYIGESDKIDYFTGEADPHKFSVDGEIIRFANLDEEVQEYVNQKEML